MKKFNLLLATCAATAAMILAPASAFASSVTECYVSGIYCVGAPSLGLDQPVLETSGGRQLVWDKRGTWGGYNKYKLEFAADTSKCVAANNAGDKVEVRDCASTGTDWFRIQYSSTEEKWGNVYVTDTIHHDDTQWVMSGTDNLVQFTLQKLGAGYFQKFKH